MTVRAFRLLCERDLAVLKEVISGRIRVWASEWLESQTTIVVDNVSVLEILDNQKIAKIKNIMVSHGNHIWCSYTNTLDAYLKLTAKLLCVDVLHQDFNSHKELLFQGILEKALESLSQCILFGRNEATHHQVEMDIQDSLPDEACKPGGCSVLLELRIAEIPIIVVLSPTIVLDLLKGVEYPVSSDSQVLTSLGEALANQMAKGKICLGSAELCVGDLLTLQVGDVLKLDQTLNTPALLEIEGRNACQVFLGRSEKTKAVRVLSEI